MAMSSVEKMVYQLEIGIREMNAMKISHALVQFLHLFYI